jgi:hypothetical protein
MFLKAFKVVPYANCIIAVTMHTSNCNFTWALYTCK